VSLSFTAPALILWRISRIGRRPKDYPPGPPTLPIIGNLHQIPKKKGLLQFEKWAREYGPVYSLLLGTKVVVVLSSDVAVKDLLDKRSAIYSSRPEFYLGQTILSGGLRPLFMVYLSCTTMTFRLKLISPFLGIWRRLAYGPQAGSWSS
jgi:hypothetical protein